MGAADSIVRGGQPGLDWTGGLRTESGLVQQQKWIAEDWIAEVNYAGVGTICAGPNGIAAVIARPDAKPLQGAALISDCRDGDGWQRQPTTRAAGKRPHAARKWRGSTQRTVVSSARNS